MNEAQTRLELIDPKLKAAGWGDVEGSRIVVEFPITKGRLHGDGGRRAKPLKADYILEYKNRRLAVIEAKPRDDYYTKGVGQAKDYADRLRIRYSYSTNGQKIYGIDMQEATEGDIEVFPTPDELWEMTFPSARNELEQDKQAWRQKLASIPFEDHGGTWQPRYYQQNAINSTLDAIADGKDRILLTLATGTGKTAIAFQIAWKLYHAKWNTRRDGSKAPRILFLADRNILADQAFNSFGAFDNTALKRIRPEEIRKKGGVPTSGAVFFTIFQTFTTKAQSGEEIDEAEAAKNLKPEDFNFGQYPRDFFDLIIVDECHRGGASDESSWRQILEYFSPAVQLGLTATPKREANADTYEYFGKPVYTYSLKEGINDGFLTPFRVVRVRTNHEGYTYVGDDKVEGGVLEVGDTFSEEEINRKVSIPEFEKHKVQRYLGLVNQNHKTLVFCALQDHALLVRDLINQFSDSKNPGYAQRVTAEDGKLGEQYLADFQNNEKTIPTVLTTSQKLSTGVDAPQIRNIVLMRPVNNMIEFKQIIGRGTRLSEGKDYFTVYDFYGIAKHFEDPEWDGEPLDPEPRTPRGEGQPHPGPDTPPEPEPCEQCGNIPCVCETPPKQMITIHLNDQKAIEIDSTIQTSFYTPEGKPISSEEFIKRIFGELPELFEDEEKLREIWSKPDTRKALIQSMEERGYSKEQLKDLQRLVHGENSDLYDVLRYIAYSKSMLKRSERSASAQASLQELDFDQKNFLQYVLGQYELHGVEEFDDERLSELLEIKYNSVNEAKSQLGELGGIRDLFLSIQEKVYAEKI